MNRTARFTTAVAALAATLITSSASAAWYAKFDGVDGSSAASGDYLLKLGGVDGDTEGKTDYLLEIDGVRGESKEKGEPAPETLGVYDGSLPPEAYFDPTVGDPTGYPTR